MSILRTYFDDQIGRDQLTQLLKQRETFVLENVNDMASTLVHIQTLLSEDGLSSVVVYAPANSFRLSDFLSALPFFGAIYVAILAIGSTARKRGDVTLRQTSNSAVTVKFGRHLSTGTPTASIPTA